MSFPDLYEGILAEFAERAAYEIRCDSADYDLNVRWTNGRRTPLGGHVARPVDPDVKRNSEKRKYAAIKSDPDRLARRRETARLSAEKKRREAGISMVRGRPKKKTESDT